MVVESRREIKYTLGKGETKDHLQIRPRVFYYLFNALALRVCDLGAKFESKFTILMDNSTLEKFLPARCEEVRL